MSDHLDERGQPCARHVGPPALRILELATLGSRIPSFHHDAASKLQSLMMALDEISELSTDADGDLRGAIATAHSATRDLHKLFAANRALAKAPQRERVVASELVHRAAERAAVKVRGEPQPHEVKVSVPSIEHGLAFLCDLVGGPARAQRVVDVAIALEGESVVISLTGVPDQKPLANAAEALAIAAFAIGAFAIGREGGTLRCSDSGAAFVVRLPTSQATDQLPTITTP